MIPITELTAPPKNEKLLIRYGKNIAKIEGNIKRKKMLQDCINRFDPFTFNYLKGIFLYLQYMPDIMLSKPYL